MPSAPDAGTGVPVTIGEAAQHSGVSAKMVRHYEALGLLGKVARTDSGYRQYTPADVHTLRFIKRCRDLGFSIEAIRELLRLAVHPEYPCQDADRMAAEHLAEVERKIAELEKLREALNGMVNCCAHTVAECRIIDALAS